MQVPTFQLLPSTQGNSLVSATNSALQSSPSTSPSFQPWFFRRILLVTDRNGVSVGSWRLFI